MASAPEVLAGDAPDGREGRPVLVGIDGSRASLRAAEWAVDEAVGRSAPLQMIYTTPQDALCDRVGRDAVEEAAAKVTPALGTVPEVREVGLLADELARLSSDASLICVGAADKCTAAMLIANSRCPLAVIQGSANTTAIAVNWVLVPISGSAAIDRAICEAVAEARLRHAKVLLLAGHGTDGIQMHEDALQRRVNLLRKTFSDIPISVIKSNDLNKPLNGQDPATRLLVLARSPNGAVWNRALPVITWVLRQGSCPMLVIPC
ncbi:universal stress protein [Mycobacterium sp. NPDC050441]|uniref:universal stress protein n=1 Tax=Mycobacterium sp. NPDC050441 TaxID=3155403 RepID=UPI0033D69857